MRKSAKRFLSTILALTMLCSCMVVMNISTAFAATNAIDLSNLYSSSDNVDLTADSTSNDEFYTLMSGVRILKSKVTDTDTGLSSAIGIAFRANVSSTTNGVKFTLTSSDVPATLSFVASSGSTNNTTSIGISTLTVTDSESTLGTQTTIASEIPNGNYVAYSYTINAAGTYVIARAESKTANVYNLTVDTYSGDTYYITGDCTGLTSGDTFTLTDSSDNDYTAVVSGDDENGYVYTATKAATSAPFTVGTDTFAVSSTDYVPSVNSVSLISYFADTLTYTADAISFSTKGTVTATVLPDSNGKFDFVTNTSSSFYQLIKDTDDDYDNSLGSAYTSTNVLSTYEDSEGKTQNYTDEEKAKARANCYVTLDESGATLYDNSEIAAPVLVVPYSADSGKVTVSGSVTTAGQVGSGWNIVDFGVAAIRSYSSNTLSFSSSTDSAAPDNYIGTATSGNTITFDIVFDLTNQTATGTISNGSDSHEFTNVTLSGSSFEGVKFVTNNGGSIGNSKARTLVIPDVTITSTLDNVITTESGNVYLVAGLSTDDDVTSYDYFYLAKDGAEVSGDSSNNTTIYTGVEIDGTTYSASSFGYDYVYGFAISDYSNLTDEKKAALSSYGLVLASNNTTADAE